MTVGELLELHADSGFPVIVGWSGNVSEERFSSVEGVVSKHADAEVVRWGIENDGSVTNIVLTLRFP